MNLLLTDEEIQEAIKEYEPVWEIDGRQLSKVEILQRQHARLRAIAKAQLQKVMGVTQSKFKREVIPSGSTRYSDDVVEFLNSMNSAYLMITNKDWQALKKECE